MKREPIRKKRLSDEVRRRLLEQIQDGHLAPGAALPSERDLMEAYGVGRPAIREAMQSLQGLGLIHVSHGERPRVAEPQLDLLAEQLSLTMRHVLTYDPDTLSQLKDARTIVESEMARIAALQRTDKDIEELEKILKNQCESCESFEEFIACDGAFHAKISMISNNLLLASVVKAIFAWLERFHTASVSKSGLEKLTLEEHGKIFEAIKAGDSDLAAEAMRLHLTRANKLYHQQNELSPGQNSTADDLE